MTVMADISLYIKCFCHRQALSFSWLILCIIGDWPSHIEAFPKVHTRTLNHANRKNSTTAIMFYLMANFLVAYFDVNDEREYIFYYYSTVYKGTWEYQHALVVFIIKRTLVSFFFLLIAVTLALVCNTIPL